MRNKYYNKQIYVNDIKFDSKHEARRYMELALLLKAGAIEELKLQPKFELLKSFKKNGKTHRAITYIADFSYIDKDTGKIVIEDCKGIKTEVYKLKKKMFEFFYPGLEITEIYAK